MSHQSFDDSNYIDPPDDLHDGYIENETAEGFFKAGLQSMREYLAKEFDDDDCPTDAAIIRSLWNPAWGTDPGKPESICTDPWETI